MKRQVFTARGPFFHHLELAIPSPKGTTPRLARSMVIASLMFGALGCTFNVQSLEPHPIPRSESGPATFSTFVARLEGPLEGGAVVIRGADRVGAAAEGRVGGLVGSSVDPGEIARGVRFDWTPSGDALEMAIRYEGPSAETVWIEQLAIELPRATVIDLVTGSAPVDIEGLGADANVETSSGRVRIAGAINAFVESGSGSIEVSGHRAELYTDSGRIDLELGGRAFVRTGSGVIRGRIGEGGDLSTGSGAITVELVTPLSRDLLLDTKSGTIELVVPPGIACWLDARSNGSNIRISAGGVAYDSSEDIVTVLGGDPTFTVRVTSQGHSIHIHERT